MAFSCAGTVFRASFYRSIDLRVLSSVLRPALIRQQLLRARAANIG